MPPLKILMLAAEAAPLVKVGGLGDVLGALPAVLRARGHDVRVAIPHYSVIEDVRYDVEPLEPLDVTWGGEVRRTPVAQVRVGGVLHYLIGGDPIAHGGTVYGPGIEVDGPKFVFFSLAALHLARAVGFRPDVLHAHDSHPGAAIYWLATQGRSDDFWQQTASVLTIHNLPFQNNHAGDALAMAGLAPSTDERIPSWARDSLMALAINCADRINTVSPGYAQEILGTEFGAGLHLLLNAHANRLSGIINGLDYEQWNPESDGALVQPFTVATLSKRAANKRALQQVLNLPVSDATLLGVVSRLDHQKGFDLAALALQVILSKRPVQLALLGAGAPEIEGELRALAAAFPAQVALKFGFDAELARQIYAGADLFLMPSRYEPCGLSQMIAMRYGAVPIVRATGGLKDTVIDYDADRKRSTGFVFEEYSVEAFVDALRRALVVYTDKRRWRALQRRGMGARFSWDASAQRYEELYQNAIKYFLSARINNQVTHLGQHVGS